MADIIEITPPGNDAAITANALPPTVGYAYPENQAPVVPAPAAVAPERSPYAKALDDLERADSQQVRANVMAAKNENPDTTARALTVAKRFGIGVDVAARNLADFEAIKKANDYEGILRGSPMLKQWLTTPVNTGVAIDDVEKLSGVESIWRGLMDTMVRAPAGQAVGFVGSTMYGLGEAYDVAARTTSRLMSEAGITSPAAGVPLPWYLDPAQILKRPGKAIKEFAKDIDVPQNRLNLADEIVGGVGQIAAQVGAVIATGGGAGLAMLFGQGVDQMIDDVEKSGKAGTFKGDLALVGGGLVTAISEKIGLDLLMNRVPPAIKNKFIRAITDIAIAGGIEAAEEAVEKIAQNVLSNYYLETDKHLLEGAGHDALVAGGSAALVRAMLLGAGRFRNRRDNQGTPLPPAEAQAEHAATSIDKMIEMANSTKLATIAPEKLQEFLATLPGQDQDKTVFVPVETVETYMQDMTSIEAANFADRLGITEQLARARVSNEDIAIPLARYVTGASEAHAKWRNDIRTEVDGFSVNQAQEWEKTREETTKAAIARFEEQIAAGVVPDGQTRVFEHVRDQLRIAGKYTNEVAAQHAALYAARYGARAARSPDKYTDAWDAFQQAGTGRGVRIESVLPDGTRAMGPDQLDILLDSIRSGKDPELRKLPQQDAQVRTAQEAAVASVLGEAPATPQTPAQAAAERQAAALTKFRTDRQELADALASIGIDIAKASNADIRAAIQKAVAEGATGRTLEQGGDTTEEADTSEEGDTSSVEHQAPVPTTVDDVAVYDSAIKVAKGQKWQKGRELKVALQNALKAVAAAAGVDVSVRSPETIDYLVRAGVRDALYALKQNPNAIGWYDLKTRQALAVMSLIHKEIATSTEARLAFVWALAVTSNGNKVDINFELAEAAYRRYRDTGTMPSDVGIGTAKNPINKSLGTYNALLERWGPENLRKFMLTEWLAGDVKTLSGIKPSGEHAGTTVRGAAILGPKIGNGFFSNLNGFFDKLTMDRWLVRTWGRWTGTLITPSEINTAKSRNTLAGLVDRSVGNAEEKARLEGIFGVELSQGMDVDVLAVRIAKVSMDPAARSAMNETELGEKIRKSGNGLAKYLDAQKEMPSGPNERNYIREVFGKILDEVRQQPGYENLEMADLQAVLWYAEKRLYEEAKVSPDAEVDVDEDGEAKGYEEEEAPDYANAAIGVARAAGISERRIKNALTKEEQNGRAADARSGDGENPGEAGQQREAGGFTESEKRSFRGATAARTVRSNRSGNAAESWSYSEEGRRDGGRVRLLKDLGVSWQAVWSAGKDLKRVFKKNEQSAPDFYELSGDSASAEKFSQQIEESKKTGLFGAAVYVYSAEDYAGMRLFLTKDGGSGFAIKTDGDIVSVFGKRRAATGNALMQVAIAAGGTKLDAFDTMLPNFYATHGFRAVARVGWNDEQAPKGWDKKTFTEFNNGEPDVVFMVYDPAYFDRYSKADGRRVASYNAGVRAQTQAKAAAPAQTGVTLEQPAFDALIADYSGEGLAIREQEIGRAEREGRLDQQGVTLNQEQNAEIISPETAKAAIAAYNDAIEPIKEQYVRYASEKQGDNYATYTLKDMEDMFGDLDEAPAEAVEIVREHGSVVWVQGSENADPEFYSPADAPSLEDHMEDVVQEQDGVFPAAGLDDINYNSTIAVGDAFDVIAKSLGWTKKGRDSKYFHVVKPIPEGSRPLDEDGEEIKELSVGIRIADHANTSRVGHAVYGKAEVHINIAPQDGMNDAHTLVEAAAMLARARYNEEGKITFAASGREAPLFQEARGSITFAENAAIIRLFQGRDLSTLIHESGHLWLQELEFDAKAADAPDAVKADWQTVLDFVGSKDGYITTEQHELFARAFETYTMEGKAPSEGLRSAFRSFRNWLVGIYRKLASLDAPISPEMRQVFDRLIATEEEIASAADTQGLNPVFTDAKSADMTEAEFKAYTKRVNAVVDEAEQKLLDKTMADIRRQRTKEWKAEQAATRIEVRDEVMADPGQAALHLLRRGELFGQETPPALKGAKLDRAELVSLVGEDGLARLPATIYKANGVPLEAIAGAVGVASPVELIERLAQLEAEQKAMAAKGDTRSVANAQIAEETMKRMTERHGDPLNDGTIEREAMDAIHGDKRGPLLAADLRVLARKAGHSGTISIKDIEGWASDTIGGMSNYLGTQFAKYQRAERVAGQKVQRALVKGDFVAAFKAKQDQLVNFALYREAKKAAADMEAAVKLNDRYASVEFIKNMDQTALDQIHQLQEQYDFKRRSGKTLAERTTFSMWKAEQEAAGFEVIDPPRLGDVGAIHYSQMTVDELRGLTDTIKQIAHLGRWKQEMKDGEKKRQFEAIVEEAVQTAGKIDQRGVDQSRRGKTSLQAALGDAAHRIRSVDSSLLKLETMFEWLDNDKTGRGVFSRVIFKRMSEAQTKEHDMQADLNKRLAAIYETVPMAQRKKWADVLTVPELPRDGQPGKFNKSQLIAVALNIGNESNLDKMLRGEKWNYDDMMAALNRHLTKEEWGFVQGSWDLVNSLWPEVEAMEKRVNGVAPPKVDAREVETAYGKFAGGYYPAKYDARESLEAEHIQNKSGEGLFDPLRLRATTRSGSTRSRKEGFAAKIKLDLSVLSSHLNEISHDLAFREAVMDSYKFLTDKRVMAAVDSAIGSEYRQQMEPWLKNIANEWANDNRGAEGIEGVARVARTNVTMVGMGFRLSTMFSQVAGFANSAQRLGTRALADGMRAVASDPRGQAAMVAEKSGEMRHRFNNLDRDIRAAMQKYEGQTGPLAEARRFAFVGIGYFDMAVTVPTWIGAYNQGLAQKMTENEAVYFADKTVRDTQGAGAAKDLAKVQRGGEMMRLFTMFYSYFNVFYNRQRGLVRDVRDIKNVGAMNVLAQSFWLLIVPSLLGQYLSGQGPEDDEDLGSWAVRNIAFGLFMGVPWARDVASTANNMAGGKSFGGAKLSPVQGIADGAFHAGKDLWHTIKGEDASKTAVKSAFSAIGLAFGLPTGQIGQTSQYVWDVVAKGSENPQNLLEWMKGLTFGPERKK